MCARGYNCIVPRNPGHPALSHGSCPGFHSGFRSCLRRFKCSGHRLPSVGALDFMLSERRKLVVSQIWFLVLGPVYPNEDDRENIKKDPGVEPKVVILKLPHVPAKHVAVITSLRVVRALFFNVG